MIEIVAVPLLEDNYAYLVNSGQTTVVIDPSESGPVSEVLSAGGWTLTAVLNTHHHWDHVGGNADLKRAFGCPVICARGDLARVPGADREMEGGQTLKIGALAFEVLFIPGHTRHHVALWLPEAEAVFTGDTLFLMGCGRLFEGTPEQMVTSLARLAALPPSTKVYCGHEYTEANAKFALALTPEDPALRARAHRVAQQRAEGRATVPATIADECATNPFLRIADDDFRNRVYPGKDRVAAFTALRLQKDNYG